MSIQDGAVHRKHILYTEFVRADRLMLALLFIQWIIASIITSRTYDTYLFGFISGGLAFFLPLAFYARFKGTQLFRVVVAVGLMSFSIIYIQQSLGRIEMHFHVFLTIAFIGYYRDTLPVLVAVVHTLIYHILFTVLQMQDLSLFGTPLRIYNYGCGWDITILHALFALLEGVIIAYMVDQQMKHHLELIDSKIEMRHLHESLVIENNKNILLLKESQQLQESLDAHSIVSRTDPKGIITYANEKFVQISGYSHEELLGHSHNLVRHPNMPKSYYKKMWQTIKEKKVFTGTMKNRAKDGHTYYVNVTIIPLVNEHHDIYEYLAVRYDVTELVAIKEALKEERAKDRFLANMSHELRTPLNAILGFLALIKKEEISDKVENYVNISLDNTSQLLYLINDILDISKMKSGKFSIVQESFYLADALEQLTNSIRSLFVEKKLDFTVHQSFDESVALSGDWQRVAQILRNLLSNAAKFTPETGKVTLDVSYAGGRLICKVTDTGIGLSLEAQQRVFKAFEQADTSVTRKYGGTGLGLKISSELALLMHGLLTLQSEEKVGSTFTLSIPMREDREIIREGQKVTEEQLKVLKGHILVAEDNKTNQLLIKLLLLDLGLSCDIANDGLEVLTMYETGKYQLILMDENMPNLGGIDTMKALHEQYEEMVPIIALTANTMKGDRERFLNEGMDDFIGKPVESTVLSSVLSKYL